MRRVWRLESIDGGFYRRLGLFLMAKSRKRALQEGEVGGNRQQDSREAQRMNW